MIWTEGPATWKQRRFLELHGFRPDRPLTKSEAEELIRKYGGDPDGAAEVAPMEKRRNSCGEEPFDFHAALEALRPPGTQVGTHEICQPRWALDQAVARRQEFWVDTCRDVAQMKLGFRSVKDLYHKYGCLLYPPSAAQVQQILDALDSAAPQWDKEHPELFYETLVLNFPDLLRRH